MHRLFLYAISSHLQDVGADISCGFVELYCHQVEQDLNEVALAHEDVLPDGVEVVQHAVAIEDDVEKVGAHGAIYIADGVLQPPAPKW